MRRSISLMAVALLAVVATALPAAATPPQEFTIQFDIVDTEPCTGDTMTVSFTFHVQELANRNTLVWVVDSYAETSTGYVANGTETQVTNKKWFMSHYNWQNVHPETGNRFSVKGAVKLNLETGEVSQDRFTKRCEGRVA